MTSTHEPRVAQPAPRLRLRDAIAGPFRALGAALFTGRAAPPHPRTGWLRPRRVERFVPFKTLDLAMALDALVAVVLYAIVYIAMSRADEALRAQAGLEGAYTGIDDYALHLTAGMLALPLLMRNRWPFAAWRLSIVGVLFTFDLTDVLKSSMAPLALAACMLCLYAVTVRGTRRATIGAWLVTVLVLLTQFWVPVLFTALVPLAMALFGYNVQVRRQTQAKLEVSERQHAEDRATVAVLEERSRIARELHDVVAHHMSIIAIQAEAAPLQSPDAPPAARESFAQIRTTALEALTETRRILGVLRNPDGPADTAPQPGLDRLDEVLAGARAGGLTVTMSERGTVRPVPSGVGLSAYRIVQESLSNAMRHAPGSAVQVLVEYCDQPAALRLYVSNGPPPGTDGRTLELTGGTGHGLVGMRERATMLGGDLSAAPTSDGGFAVVATLPLEDS